jgi:hypothetical protein
MSSRQGPSSWFSHRPIARNESNSAAKRGKISRSLVLRDVVFPSAHVNKDEFLLLEQKKNFSFSLRLVIILQLFFSGIRNKSHLQAVLLSNGPRLTLLRVKEISRYFRGCRWPEIH